MLTDTHCHLFKEYYENIDLVINNAIKSGVSRYIVSGCDHKSNVEVIEINNPNVYKVIGLHPEVATKYYQSDIDYISDNVDKIIGIGEIGLDYYYGKEDKESQIELFKKQLQLAESVNKPVVIHSRDAVLDTLTILKEYHVKGVIHSFSGSLETAREYIKMGFVLGINGIVTFKNCNLKDILVDIGIENIVLETDCPYLTPVPYRGEKNEPAHIKDIALFVSEIYGTSVKELEEITNRNIKRIFDI